MTDKQSRNKICSILRRVHKNLKPGFNTKALRDIIELSSKFNQISICLGINQTLNKVFESSKILDLPSPKCYSLYRVYYDL